MNQMVDYLSVLETPSFDAVLENKSRRREKDLTDAIMIAFHSACDLKDLAVAWRLLQTLENMLTLQKDNATFNRRRALSVLVAGHERLWNIRHD